MKNYNDIESEDLYDMAIEWIKNIDYDRAIDCLKRAINLNPNFIHAYITLAEVLAKQKKYSDAVHILKRASKVDPKFDRLNYLMARYAYKGGDYPTALKYITMAIEKSPQPLYMKSQKVIERAMLRLK
jgi:tetratricopeptide (TPR) repeat protein